ncbi:Fic family protein [Kribbella sp. NBC_00382]|uniref:Fic family protein n=1 Tax=Kribbella sp. NBC_00382 TaxID=2975967 RepID=UPI002E1AD6C4
MATTVGVRRYEETHPWLTFKLDLNRLSHRTWMLLGEAQSKCEHIAGVPLRPEIAKQLMAVYLSKGAHGTTSIEGNTLSEGEVMRRVEGDLDLPVSREYLGQEIDNIVEAYNGTVRRILKGEPVRVTPEHLLGHHAMILRGQPRKPDVEPGQFRNHSVGVANYRGAPAEDIPYLLNRLCSWLSNDFTVSDEHSDMHWALNVMKALMAHLYIAWIHPFGDGNGRVSRMLEFEFLVQAGVPLPACHVLSDHYNRTREAYYAALARTSREDGYPVEVFIQYAIQGFVDELREQLSLVRDHQMDVTWQNYVHDVYRDQDTPARRRQRHIALDLPIDEPTPRAKLRVLSARVAAEYAGKTSKTVARDLNELTRAGLVIRTPRGILPNRDLIRAFLAARAEPPEAAPTPGS